jgi:peptidoglycan/xylan/chitin deacetylase (PgdA/CDA1 family)
MVKGAYLTIDDGPSRDMDSKVRFLFKKGIPAVWFCIGDFIRKRPEKVMEAIEHGFIIGNHSYSHPHFSKISFDSAYDEIHKTDYWIEKIYAKTGLPRKHKYFRFPYGDKGDYRMGRVLSPISPQGEIRKQVIQSILKGAGYTQPLFPKINHPFMVENGLLKDIDWHWTFDLMEWSLKLKGSVLDIDSLEKVLIRIDEPIPLDCRGEIPLDMERGLNRGNHSEILLIHDHPETSMEFEKIIDYLLAKPIQFLTIP